MIVRHPLRWWLPTMVSDAPAREAEAMAPATAIAASRAVGATGDQLVHGYAERRQARDLEAAVRHYLPLARRLSHRYARPGVPADDLEQVAAVGLVKAVQRFDPDRGCRFSTYAVPTILGELRRHCRDTAWSAHVPRPVQERLFAVRRAEAAWRHEHAGQPTVADLARRAGCCEEEVVEALVAERALSHLSLDSAVTDEDGDEVSTRLDRVGDEDPAYDRIECLAAIEDAMGSLDARELEVLRLRYAEELTHPQIAARLNLPVTRIGRCLNETLGRLTARATAGGTA